MQCNIVPISDFAQVRRRDLTLSGQSMVSHFRVPNSKFQLTFRGGMLQIALSERLILTDRWDGKVHHSQGLHHAYAVYRHQFRNA